MRKAFKVALTIWATMICTMVVHDLVYGQDTLWVARLKKPQLQRVVCVLMPGWEVRSIPNSETAVNIFGVGVLRDSLGRIRYTKPKILLYGVDTALVEFRYTTEDTIPGDYGKVPYIFSGGFEKK